MFRSVSPASPFDLIAMQDGKLWRIEVKTSGYTSDGCVSVPSNIQRQDELDFLAVVTHDKIIHYFPEIDELAPTPEAVRGISTASAHRSPVAGPT